MAATKVVASAQLGSVLLLQSTARPGSSLPVFDLLMADSSMLLRSAGPREASSKARRGSVSDYQLDPAKKIFKHP